MGVRVDDKLFLRLLDVEGGPLVRGLAAEVMPALRGIEAALTGVLLLVGAGFFLLQDLASLASEGLTD